MRDQYVLTVGLPDPVLAELLRRMKRIGGHVISAIDLSDARWIVLHRAFRMIVMDMEYLDYQDVPSFTEALSTQSEIILMVLNEKILLKFPPIKTVVHLRSRSPAKITRLAGTLLKTSPQLNKEIGVEHELSI